jgi:hypothetical protein
VEFAFGKAKTRHIGGKNRSFCKTFWVLQKTFQINAKSAG